MKDTKKMLEIIEKQYREANKEYREKQEKKAKRELKRQSRRDCLLGASIFMNIVIILIIIACR